MQLKFGRKSMRQTRTSFALSYAISALIVSIASLLGMMIWLYQVIAGDKSFSWTTLSVFILIISVSGLIGSALLKASRDK